MSTDIKVNMTCKGCGGTMEITEPFGDIVCQCCGNRVIPNDILIEVVTDVIELADEDADQNAS